ncbi:hypothetical protein AB0756_25285 [Tolypothrix campylonemoides VB511288_2]|uniref:Transposase n=2 Tax=Nostocales TaxID=1161 RepID=A0ABW8WVY3_9CYAN
MMKITKFGRSERLVHEGRSTMAEEPLRWTGFTGYSKWRGRRRKSFNCKIFLCH